MKKTVMTATMICLTVAVLAWQGAMAGIGLSESGLQSQMERVTRSKGDVLSISVLSASQLAAAKALPEAAQVALMKELAAAAKTIVMSPAFQSAHNAYIAKEYQAVDHGLKVKSLEQAAASARGQSGQSEVVAKLRREMSAQLVQMVMDMNIENLKTMFDSSLKNWTENANDAKRSDRAKYAKLVARAQAIKDLSVSDPDKFRRGYAVLRSADDDGPDTEEALFGAQASAQKDNEQLAWDEHNLRGGLKRVLTQIVAEAPTVDFAAQTVQKGSVKVFVNPNYEKKSVTWKAMYRAGKGPTAAGLEVAKAWLKEL